MYKVQPTRAASVKLVDFDGYDVDNTTVRSERASDPDTSAARRRQLTTLQRRVVIIIGKGAITSKIKHAIKHKTSPARLAKLLHNCCSPH